MFRALQLDPKLVRSHIILAFAYYNYKLTENALEQARFALSLDFEFPLLMVLLAMELFLLGAGKTDEGLSILQRAVQIDPENYLAHNNLAYICSRIFYTTKYLMSCL